MSHGGFSPEMERALEADAAKLTAMGADPGGTLEDFDGDGFDMDEFMDEMNCGSPRKGECSHVASEYCDFVCPFRKSVFG